MKVEKVDKRSLLELVDEIEDMMNCSFRRVRIVMFICGTVNGLFIYHFFLR